ncbi:MAG: S1 RNA-binding domain-containing protein [Planctomycetota bacterium]|nr:MAG: S1 RNA-binding domain-containing protein [Planctomycetota bacterium]
MSAKSDPKDDSRVARALGLKVPVYRHLRQALDRGESLAWLRLADPELAGIFSNPLGFELLIENLEVELAFARRRANLLRALDGQDQPELEEAVRAAASEGELEDLHLALSPSPAPEGWEPPEKEEYRAFVESLRGNHRVAAGLRRLFREHALVRVEIAAGKEKEAARFASLAGEARPAADLPLDSYLPLRRAEHARLLRLQFELPRAELDRFFESQVDGVPPQERDVYRRLFAEFFVAERLPRYVQEARSRFKRAAESRALERAWPQVEAALDRGRQDGPVLGLFAHRNGRCLAALVDGDGRFLRAASLSAKAPDLAERFAAFLGDLRPVLAALQADGPSRTHGGAVLAALEEIAGGKVRQILVPVAVARTLAREVARRLEEAHLSQDERQAALLARFGHFPRAMVLHSPHVVRAYVPFRSEINSRRLEAFESIFIETLLANRGVDLNLAGADELRQVPGLDHRAVEVERSTAPFRSLVDFQARCALPADRLRTAACFLRVRNGDEPLDARPLHPIYYGPLRQALAAGGVELKEILRDPAKVGELPWEPILEERGWPARVVDLIRRGLARSPRRPRRMPPRRLGSPLETLQVGARMKGRITRVVEHGVFVDVGARREGFAHVSELADRFVKDPAEVVQEGQEVEVRILSIDLERQRFRVSLRSPGERTERGRGEGRRGRQTEEPPPPHVRVTRPKSRRPGGRPGRREDPRREEKVVLGRDPRAEEPEEIDPTNPFYQFFKARQEQQAGPDEEGGQG